jgi:modification methylase
MTVTPEPESEPESVPMPDPESAAASEPTARRSTTTSRFGTSRRESHDASDFYERFPAPTILTDTTVEDAGAVKDTVIHGDSRDLSMIPDNSVALVVTSPPYFAGKEYEATLGEGHVPASYVEYLEMLRDVFQECWRVLEPGGRIAVNVANLGRKPYRSLAGDIIGILQDDLGYLLRGEIIWVKGAGLNSSCAWGSYASASNPVLRDVTERIVVGSKGRFGRALTKRQRQARGLPFEDTITPDEFRELTLDTWRFATESARRVGHPAPFPVEPPRRCIELFTFRGDTVLDPFAGVGTVGVAAVSTGRHFVCVDADAEYVTKARERIEEAQSCST